MPPHEGKADSPPACRPTRDGAYTAFESIAEQPLLDCTVERADVNPASFLARAPDVLEKVAAIRQEGWEK